MNGTQIRFADYVSMYGSYINTPGADWHLLGTADFDGDGKNDLLWRTDGGALAIWEMNGTVIKAADYIRIGGTQINAPGSDWHVAGLGDYDGDGRADLLWRTDGGALGVWEMNGTQIKFADYISMNGSYVGVPGADWHIVQPHHDML